MIFGQALHLLSACFEVLFCEKKKKLFQRGKKLFYNVADILALF